jgi:hypothetical protein
VIWRPCLVPVLGDTHACRYSTFRARYGSLMQVGARTKPESVGSGTSGVPEARTFLGNRAATKQRSRRRRCTSLAFFRYLDLREVYRRWRTSTRRIPGTASGVCARACRALSQCPDRARPRRVAVATWAARGSSARGDPPIAPIKLRPAIAKRNQGW